MAGENSPWEIVTLGELGNFRNGVNFSSEDYGPGIPIINVKQLFRGRYAETKGLLTILASTISNINSVRLQRRDILFARSSVKASGAGQVAMVEDCPQNTVFSGFIIRFRLTEKERAIPEFLNYLIRSPEYRELLTRIGSGTTITNLSQGTLAELPISLPPLAEQHAIAHILGTLDDKIELNRKMNETLEAMARGLFKSWFVDFDPVRAKAEGRDTGLPKEIADLFPYEFEDSELGEIPKGWEVKPLGSVVTNVVERVHASEFTKANPYVPIECITPRSISLWEFQKGENAYSSLIRFKRGDILFGAMRPYFHKVCIAPFEGSTRTTAFVLRPNADELGFAVFVIGRDETVDYATAHSEGTTIPYAKWAGSLEMLPVIFPPDKLRQLFHHFVISGIERMTCLVKESSSLAMTRDTLLPKLISGELRVPEAEKIVEAIL